MSSLPWSYVAILNAAISSIGEVHESTSWGPEMECIFNPSSCSNTCNRLYSQLNGSPQLPPTVPAACDTGGSTGPPAHVPPLGLIGRLPSHGPVFCSAPGFTTVLKKISPCRFSRSSVKLAGQATNPRPAALRERCRLGRQPGQSPW